MEEIPLKKKKGTWWKWLIMLALSAFLLYFAFRGVKWSDFAEGLKSCNYWWICASMAASILAFLFRGIRWRLIMLPLNPSIKRREAYDGVTVAYLTNFALPRAGEFARCGVIAATGKASFEAVLGTVVLERSWDMVCYILILLSILLIRWNQFGDFMTKEIWNPLISRLPFSAAWLAVGILAIIVLVCVLLYRYRTYLKKYKFFNKFYKICRGLIDGLISGFKMKDKWKFIILTVMVWVCYWFMSRATIYAFPQVQDLNGVDALFLMVVAGLGWIVPVQGGIGAYHFIVSLAIASIYGIPQTSGVIFATISHESQALTMIICGAISLLSISLSKKFIAKRKN
jgi:glycosyltransferase 2 family protein